MNNKLFESLLFESEEEFEQINEGVAKTLNKVDNHLKRNAVKYGAATGALVGAAGGPVGAAAGAAIGAASGYVKKKAHQYKSANPDKKAASNNTIDKKSTKKINQDIDTFENFTQLDFEKFEDEYLQNQQGWDLDIDEEMQSLNEDEKTYKPKLSAKKQLGTYKYCTLDGVDYLLIREIGPTYKDDYVVRLEDGWDMKNTISDLFEMEKLIGGV